MPSVFHELSVFEILWSTSDTLSLFFFEIILAMCFSTRSSWFKKINICTMSYLNFQPFSFFHRAFIQSAALDFSGFVLSLLLWKDWQQLLSTYFQIWKLVLETHLLIWSIFVIDKFKKYFLSQNWFEIKKILPLRFYLWSFNFQEELKLIVIRFCNFIAPVQSIVIG